MIALSPSVSVVANIKALHQGKKDFKLLSFGDEEEEEAVLNQREQKKRMKLR